MADFPSSFQIPEQMRYMADKSVDEARKAFDQFVNATQKAMSTADNSAKSAQTGVGDASRQALAYVEENVAASFELAQRLVRARTIEEVTALQQEFLKKQFEAVASQGKALADTFMQATKKG